MAQPRKRWVYGIIEDGNGVPVLGGQVKFTINRALGYGGKYIVVPRIFFTTTDATTDTNADEVQRKEPGKFRILLVCDNDLLNAVDYQMFVPVADNGQAATDSLGTLSLFYENGSPKEVGDLLAESSAPENIAARETLVSLIRANSVDCPADSPIPINDVWGITAAAYAALPVKVPGRMYVLVG